MDFLVKPIELFSDDCNFTCGCYGTQCTCQGTQCSSNCSDKCNKVCIFTPCWDY